MTRQQVVQKLVGELALPKNETGKAFAPSNIALCKYWGKRNSELNLPINSSLSISLGHLGTETILTRQNSVDEIWLNGKHIEPTVPFAVRLKNYLDLFRPEKNFYFHVDTKNNFPTAAGLASSASGYAALVKALNDLFGWRLENQSLSILARLGSGSAARSIYRGFVEWFRGELENGLDSYAERLPASWPEFRLAVVTVSHATKPVGSTEGMKRTVETSTLYKSWPEKAERDMMLIRRAIEDKNFKTLGATAESNALSMHATMLDTQPAVLYWLPETVAIFYKIWQLRRDGLQLYFTIDAGPNVKLLFEEKNESLVFNEFCGAEMIRPFD